MAKQVTKTEQNLETFKDLWGCREIVKDGETEYGGEFLVRARSLEKAEIEAWEHVKRNYIYDCEDNKDNPYQKFMNDDGWMESPGDYRLFKAEVVRPITSLEVLFQFIPVNNSD